MFFERDTAMGHFYLHIKSVFLSEIVTADFTLINLA